MSIDYDDEYPSCERTDVVLRIYPGERDPGWITRTLGIEPSSVNRQGEQSINSLGLVRTSQINSWFLSSAGQLASKDSRRHLDWLLDALTGSEVRIRELVMDATVRIDVICVWWSAAGHGGPVLSPAQMSRLADLGLQLGFDLYFFLRPMASPTQCLRLVSSISGYWI